MSPRQPHPAAPDSFWLAIAAELGIDPGKVLDGTMEAEAVGNDRVLVSWKGAATMPSERFRQLLDEHWAKANTEPHD